MKDHAPDDTVIERLRVALTTKSLPQGARDHADHLLRRLSSPVRVTLLGKPGSGKSELVNMFAGRRLIPKDARLPTMELVHGNAENMTITTSTGEQKVLDGISLDDISKNDAAFLRLQMPLPLLERISLLEVVTSGATRELNAAVDWATRRTDIALWCSHDFDADEQKLWHRVPDALKDHAFLVLTKADQKSPDKSLAERVAGLQTIVSEEFHSLFTVATLQAIKAQRADGTIDAAMRHASGGGALSAAVLRHADRGRRADIDSAELFLARHRVPTRPISVPLEEKPATEEVLAPPVAQTPEPVPHPPNDAVSVDLARSPEVTEDKPAVATQAPTPPANVALFSDAVRYLRKRGDGLTQSVTQLGASNTNSLLDQCVDTVEHLVDLFSQDESGCTAADDFIDELTEASDLMVLMQAEVGDAPVADAVTLLLQLRRDMEETIAA